MPLLAAEKAQILSLCIESTVYGIFAPLYVATLWCLSRRKCWIFMDRIMIGTVTCMFLIATAHLSISVSRAFDAFAFTGAPQGNQAANYYRNFTNKKLLALDTLFMIQTFLGDSFIIFRLFVVWERSLPVIIGPSLLLLGWFSVATVTSVKLSQAKLTDSIFDFLPWITADCCISLATSISCTVLIAGRIWIAHRHSLAAGLRGATLAPTIVTVIESAAIYSSAVLSVLIVYLTGNNGEFFDLLTPLIGVAFCLIIVQVHIRRATESDHISKLTTFSPASRSRPSRYFSTSLGSYCVESGPGIPHTPRSFQNKSESQDIAETVIGNECDTERDSTEVITGKAL